MGGGQATGLDGQRRRKKLPRLLKSVLVRGIFISMDKYDLTLSRLSSSGENSANGSVNVGVDMSTLSDNCSSYYLRLTAIGLPNLPRSLRITVLLYHYL